MKTHLIYIEGEKLENVEKTHRARKRTTTNSAHMTPSLVG